MNPASESSQHLLRDIVGDLRLRMRLLPPPSPFMRLVQRKLQSNNSQDWSDLRGAAEEFMQSCGGVLPIDTTGLPEWWKEYDSGCLAHLDGELHGPKKPWDLCQFILQLSGSVVGTEVRRLLPIHVMPQLIFNRTTALQRAT